MNPFRRFWNWLTAPYSGPRLQGGYQPDPRPYGLGPTQSPPKAPGAMKINLPKHLTMVGDVVLVKRPIVAPQLPPGVVPDIPDDGYIAFDAVPANQWTARQFEAFGSAGFPGYPLLAQLSRISEYRSPAETTAKEMTRKWITFHSKGDKAKKANDPKAKGTKDEKIKEIGEAFKKHGIQKLFRWAVHTDKFFGRSQIYIDVGTPTEGGQITPLDKADRSTPLLIDPETIKKGSLRGFKKIEPQWTTPLAWNASDPTADDFYIPTSWYVMGTNTHTTRLLTFVSSPVPDLLKPAYNFGGLSLSQLMEPGVNYWLNTRAAVNQLINNYSVMILKTNMQATLAGEDDGTPVTDRAKMFVLHRNNQNLTVIDKNSEEIDQVAVPLSGLDKLQAQAQEHMGMPTHTPQVKLTGVEPTGLSASTEGTMQCYYDYIHAEQEAVFTDPLDIVLDVIQLDLYGVIDDDIDYEYAPLKELTGKEEAEIRDLNAKRDVAYVGAGVVDSDEVRDRLVSDPDSGYNNLVGPAPEAPALQEIAANGALKDGEEDADEPPSAKKD